MIYQVFHQPHLLASCDTTSTKNRPIGVGAAVGFCQEQHRLHDALGPDHISPLNPKLNEWTAIYWLWKNLANLDDPDGWIGLSHYRRPAPAFARCSEVAVVEAMLCHDDVIAWIPNISSLAQQAAKDHPGLVHTILAAISRCYGRAACDEAQQCVNQHLVHPFSNCFIMKKDRFEHYAGWCWKILGLLIDVHRQNNPG